MLPKQIEEDHRKGRDGSMNAKTMEGLMGAGLNIKIRDTPMRVYKEAEREGDLAKMERAMGYANEFAGRAAQYQTKAEEGMEDELEEIREEQEEKREDSANKDTDTVEVSEERKEMLANETNSQQTEGIPAGEKTAEPVIYTQSGKTEGDPDRHIIDRRI